MITTKREEQIKNEVAEKWFKKFDTTKILKNIDFCASLKKQESLNFTNFDNNLQSFLWAEAKRGSSQNIIESFIQLILTVGKAKTFEKYMPPKYLGAFDAEKISFIEYNIIAPVFYQNDFNWNITSSDHNTKEFKQLYDLIAKQITKKSVLFNFKEDEKELKEFIDKNFKFKDSTTNKITITKNNFISIYLKWLDQVKNSIAVDWQKAKQFGILDADFYLADLLSKDNNSINENLFVILEHNKETDRLKYKYNRQSGELGDIFYEATFKDSQDKYKKFWNKYDRPPRQEFQKYILDRRDLLVPQDIRERKGSFFTPQKWVELSQKYLQNYLGENWQDEYYIWDCCAGTGNMEIGLTNKYNVWCSTLDKADVDIMLSNAKTNKNLLESHIFQFDFLNDEFSKLPQELQNIINDQAKREKLVVYINPPYVEGDNKVGKGRKQTGASNTRSKYAKQLGQVNNELFAQFLMRIYKEIPNCIIGNFSTLKILQAPKSKIFRQNFKAKLESLFLTPANTFDNVKGQFPIGFHIWNLKKKEIFKQIIADIYDKDSNFIGKKEIISYDNSKYISDWFRCYTDNTNTIGKLGYVGNDLQNQNFVFITIQGRGHHQFNISKKNFIQSCIYLAVRHCIEHTYFNHYDQFLFPNNNWEKDKEFQSNCLIYSLFHTKNEITIKNGVNHWIPFTENEIEPREKIESHFMSDYIKQNKIKFSLEAKEVLETAKKLFKYYHSQEKSNPNASFYDIKEFFKGRNEKGRINNKSNDETFNLLIDTLREKQKLLAEKIREKVFEYKFLI